MVVASATPLWLQLLHDQTEKLNQKYWSVPRVYREGVMTKYIGRTFGLKMIVTEEEFAPKEGETWSNMVSDNPPAPSREALTQWYLKPEDAAKLTYRDTPKYIMPNGTVYRFTGKA